MKKVGLALGGGGARGCAHIGVIKALREADIPVNYIAGTSIGALIGGFFATGKIEIIEYILSQITWKDVMKYFDPVIPKRGLFEGKKVVKLLKSVLKDMKFTDTQIPYIAVATNLLTGKEIDINKGKIVDAIRASIAIPGIITPAKWNRKYLMDGGVVNPLPVDVVKKMGADIVIAVDLNHSYIQNRRYAKGYQKMGKIAGWVMPSRPNILDIAESSIFMLQDQLTKKNLEKHEPNYLIRPQIGQTSVFDFHKAKKLIAEGYKQGKKIIPKLKKELKM